MSALLEVNRITAGYTSDIDIVRDVTVAAHAGSIHGLIGLNGAGKSTVLKVACGLLRTKAGEVRYDGADITGAPTHRLLPLGLSLIPQESSLFEYLSVEDNLVLPLRRRYDGRERRREAEMLEATLAHFPDLKLKLKSAAGSLSGGQQKMLEFAKAHIVQPRVCLIDEPSIGLAPKIAGLVFEWIQLFAAQGMAILLVDHNIRKVVELSDYVYVLSLGEIAAQGPRSDFERDLHEQVTQWLGLAY